MFLGTKHPYKLLKDAIEPILIFRCANFWHGRLLAHNQFNFRNHINDDLSILGLKANAPQQQLKVQPLLPKWLPDLTLTNLSVGDATVAVRFWRAGIQTRWEVTELDG